MSDKSPHKTRERKPGMTLKEKRAAKKAKKNTRQREAMTAERL
jgi:hypothetical protein